VSEPLGTVAELSAALEAGRTSAVELVERALARAAAWELRLHALLSTRPDAARAEAEAWGGGHQRGT
jgi:Asp-tRNA(Asn)/Glu-tRNA(Gln) amidotransferase A subunit family amidase